MGRNSLNRMSLYLAVLVIVSLGGGPSRATIDGGHLVILGGSVEQREVARWAASRFSRAGIETELPSIHLHQGTRRCAGNGGFTDVLPEGISVHVCIENATDLRRKLLHEMTHAWDFAHRGIPAEVRAEFLTLRGLETWNDRRQDWPRRGAEQAAEIIAWGLQESFRPIPTRVGLVGPNDPASLTAAFELLVGRPPLWMGDDLGQTPMSGTWEEV